MSVPDVLVEPISFALTLGSFFEPEWSTIARLWCYDDAIGCDCFTHGSFSIYLAAHVVTFGTL